MKTSKTHLTVTPWKRVAINSAPEATSAAQIPNDSALDAFGTYHYTASPAVQRRAAAPLATAAGGMRQRPVGSAVGLPDRLRSGIEAMSGLSFAHVNVHYNSMRPAQIGALAYAQGNSIHLAAGQERHLPHEAWHLVQQAQGRVQSTLQMQGGTQINDDVRLEREADVMGARALAGAGARHAALAASPAHHFAPGIAANAPVQRVEVARIMDDKKQSSYLSPAAQKSEASQRDEYNAIVALIKGGDPELISRLEGHAQGDKDANSPFISVARNFVSLSYSTDDSENGVQTILENAPSLVYFDVPDDGVEGVYLLPAMSALSLNETELLVLLPPGVSLLKYLKPASDETGPAIVKNPYLGKSAAQRDQYNKELGLTRTVFTLSEEEGLSEIPYVEAAVAAVGGAGQLTAGDLTANEMKFIVAMIVGELGTTVDKFNGWTLAQRNQYLLPKIQEYLQYVGADASKRKL